MYVQICQMSEYRKQLPVFVCSNIFKFIWFLSIMKLYTGQPILYNISRML